MALRPRVRRTRLLVVTLISVCLVIITVDYQQGANGPLEGLGRMTLSVITPMQEAVSKITRPVGAFFSAVGSLPTLKEENERLQEELDQARTQLAAQADLAQEVADLRRQLGYAEIIDAPRLPAFVIANGVSNFEWSITIDRGADDGVQPGDPVIASAGLVGRVTRVTGGSADVLLIIDPDSSVAARVEGVDNASGEVSGRGEGDMQMGFIDADVPAEELNGRLVVTSGYSAPGYSNRYPPHVPIGRVSRVLDSSGSLTKYVTVQPTVDFSSLSEVLVVLSETPT